MTSTKSITLCSIISILLQFNISHALTMYIGDGSYSEDIKAEITLDSYTKESQHYLTVKIENQSNDIYDDLTTTTVTPFITAFAFNLPEGVSAALGTVSDAYGNDISGWFIPYVGMKTTIPSPDNHGFWDAGASVGKLFTSGSPENGIAPDNNNSYFFNFLLSGEQKQLISILADANSILAEPPSFGPSAGGGGSGTGGGGGSPGYGKGKTAPQSAETDGETTDGGIPSLDWDEYFLVNMKGYPEGTIDFGLLVPASVLSPPAETFMAQRSLAPLQAVATPEPSTLTLMAAGALCAAFALRRRTKSAI